MSTTAPLPPGLSRTSSAVRLAVATKAMAQAETLQAVIAAKDKAKDLGLLPKDLEALRQEFARAKARFR
jgi:hypothetical protein